MGLLRSLRLAVACATVASTSLAAGRPGVLAAPASLHAWSHPDRFVYGDQIEPDSLNPYLSNTFAARRVDELVFSGLLRYGARGVMQPDLATVVPTRANGGISTDGRTIVYHLRPGVRWHDGAPVTSADVAFTWRAVMDPKHLVTTRVGFDRIERIETPDARTVRTIFRTPYAPALAVFCVGLGAAAVLPEHAFAGHDFNTAPFGSAPVGTGPYAFVRWNHGSAIELRADPHYHLGAAAIRTIEYRIVPDTTTLFNAIRTHEIDGGEIEATFVPQLRGDAGLVVATGSTVAYRHLEFNVSRGPLRERDVRLALSYALDRSAIYHKIYFGIGETSPGDVLPSTGWGDPRLPPYPHDVARAERLLDRAGYRRGPDGVRAKNGARLDFTLAAIAGQRPAEATEVLLQSDWAKIGVTVTIKNAPGVFLFSAPGPLVRGDFDIAYFGWTDDVDPDDSNRFNSMRVPPSGQNYSRFADAEVDRLQAASLAELDVARRHRIVARIADAIVARDPIDTIYWIPTIVAHNADVRGIDPIVSGTIFWNVARWRFAG